MLENLEENKFIVFFLLLIVSLGILIVANEQIESQVLEGNDTTPADEDIEHNETTENLDDDERTEEESPTSTDVKSERLKEEIENAEPGENVDVRLSVNELSQSKEEEIENIQGINIQEVYEYPEHYVIHLSSEGDSVNEVIEQTEATVAAPTPEPELHFFHNQALEENLGSWIAVPYRDDFVAVS